MSESLERSVEELKVEVARLSSRVRALEKGEVRFGGALEGRTNLGRRPEAGIDGAPIPVPNPGSIQPPVPAAPPTPAAASIPPLTQTPPPPPLRVSVPPAAARTPVSAPPPAPSHSAPAPALTADRNGSDLESRMGLTWVNRIGAVTLILAAGFVFKYAADNGWIGPWTRVLAGMIAGAAACATAELLVRRGHRVVAQGVAGVGIAIFYFSLFASYQIFELLPQLAVFGLMAGVTVLGGILAVRYQGQALAVLAAAGGFLTPVMLSTGENRPWELNIYLLVLAGGSVYLAVKQRWQGLAWMAYLGTKLLFWASVIEDEGRTTGYPSLVFGVLYYALFLMTPWRGIAAFAQVSFGFAMLTGGAWANVSIWTWQLLLPLLAGLVVASLRKRTVEAVAAMITAHISVGFGLLMMLGLSDDVIIPKDAVGVTILAAIWAGFAGWLLLGWLRLSRVSIETAAVMFALNSIAFAGEGIALIEQAEWQSSGTFLFALAAVHLAMSLQGLGALLSEERFASISRIAQCLGIFFLACGIPVQLHGPVIAALWAGMSLALAWASSRVKAQWMTVGSYLLFAAAVVRLAAIDLPDLSVELRPFAHGIFYTAMLTGSAMLAASWVWRASGHRWVAAFAGHFTLLLTLIIEVIRMAERMATGGNVLIVQTAMISVLLGFYAAILVAVGVITKTRPNRIGGLVLLLIVVAKLYVFDVWLLDTLFRIVAFGALGSMLLVTSFLYSRLRHTVKQFLGDESKTPVGPVAPPPPQAS